MERIRLQVPWFCSVPILRGAAAWDKSAVAKQWTTLKGPGLTRSGKTHSSGRPGIHPRYKDNEISGGFSH